MSSRFSLLTALPLMVLIAGCGSTTNGPTAQTSVSDEASPGGTSSPRVASSPPAAPSARPSATSTTAGPTGFTTTVDNPWFPLIPGTVFTYQGTKDGKKAVETFSVTRDLKTIDGVRCVVIQDEVALGGVAAEKLFGYYAQDPDGNVWYFGEDMLELDANGNVVATAGSWHAGLNRAQPALVMEASPKVGDTFAHDYTKNDWAVVSASAKVTVPLGAFSGAVMTREWSPLEPDLETHKYYVRGVGQVRDVAVKGPTEELALVKVEHT
jgi:hypothetical protein